MTDMLSPTRRLAMSNGPSYQELLDTDTHPVPDVFRWESPVDFADQSLVPIRRYISRDYHELEKERLWSKVWQMACRAEEIPEVGDTYVYDICDWSILIVRSAPDEIKAFYNACLHRGRKIRHEGGPSIELRCPFHGFCWDHSGKMKRLTCEWDFPHLNPQSMDLPELLVGTWGGFVFVNMDLNAEPLEDFLGDLDSHFAQWPLEDRYIEAHIAKVIRCNWKIAQEAFSEAFHVVTTHPQRLPSMGDANSQYDVWGNFSRGLTPNGVPSPHISWQPTEQEMFDAIIDSRIDEPPMVTVPEGMTAREFSGILTREGLRPVIGDEKADQLSDAESLDAIYYTVFPNFHPWGAYQRIVYRFRPNGDDHETCIMEVYFLSPFDGDRPPPAKVRWLGVDEDWTAAKELGTSARVFDQDSYNMPHVHAGLKTTKSMKVPLARYQESKIRHIHHLLEKWIGE